MRSFLEEAKLYGQPLCQPVQVRLLRVAGVEGFFLHCTGLGVQRGLIVLEGIFESLQEITAVIGSITLPVGVELS